MSRRVVAVVSDLLFQTRIAETASQAGVDLMVVPAPLALSTCENQPPDLIVLDLADHEDPVSLAYALHASLATRNVPIVGFYPHVDNALRQRALAAGIPHVLPRSAFVARMAEILQTGPRPPEPPPAMTDTATPPPGTPTERVYVTCPGCGRHDWVNWPAGSATYPWKCFNCGKQFALERGGRH
jgi:CheY-like chemotaxis protein/ribosomal protein S27E